MDLQKRMHRRLPACALAASLSRSQIRRSEAPALSAKGPGRTRSPRLLNRPVGLFPAAVAGEGAVSVHIDCHGVRGLEHLPPVSTPFRRFLSRLTCWAPAQRRSLGAKITRKLPAHRCFAVFTEQNWAEARRRPQGILSYFQGLERSISPILPVKTDRGSSPLTLANFPSIKLRSVYQGSIT